MLLLKDTRQNDRLARLFSASKPPRAGCRRRRPFLNTSPAAGLLPFFSLLVLLGLVSCGDAVDGDNRQPATRIGIYNGSGTASWPESAVAVKAAVEPLGRPVDFISEGQIQSSLQDYLMLIFPGGNPLDMSSALGYTGRERIRNLVQSGGAFIGLGGGAYLAADTIVFNQVGSVLPPIGLFEGVASGPISTLAPINSYEMTPVQVADSRFVDPDWAGTIISTLYKGGPEWIVTRPASTITLANYSTSGDIAALGFEYGLGRVVLISFQPEIEENSDRDGNRFADDRDDQESDWYFLQRAVEWSLRQLP